MKVCLHKLLVTESRTELERVGGQIVPIMTQAMAHVMMAVRPVAHS